MELKKYIKEFLKNKENEQAVLDYIFGKREDNILEEARATFRKSIKKD